jgi:hypothetical protein
VNPEEGERPPLEAATKQRLVKTEKTLCAAVTVMFGVGADDDDKLEDNG